MIRIGAMRFGNYYPVPQYSIHLIASVRPSHTLRSGHAGEARAVCLPFGREGRITGKLDSWDGFLGASL
jgi:hypothetical protein